MKLTHMEERVVHQLCKGYISKQIADKLGISVRTVESHIFNARQRNGLRTANQLCAMWTKEIYETANQSRMVSQPYVPLGNTPACG